MEQRKRLTLLLFSNRVSGMVHALRRWLLARQMQPCFSRWKAAMQVSKRSEAYEAASSKELLDLDRKLAEDRLRQSELDSLKQQAEWESQQVSEDVVQQKAQLDKINKQVDS